MQKTLLALFLFFASLSAEPPPISPTALQKGDLIALVFPASFLKAEENEAQGIMTRKAKWLQSRGYRTIFYPAKVNRIGYLAGTDEERAEAFMNAWKDEEVKAIWCFRGDYGTERILANLDYEYIQTHPKILIGMSDITALHQSIQLRTGLVTFLAPVLNFFDENGDEFDDFYAFSSLEQVVANQMTADIFLPPEIEIGVIRPGKARGSLVGGNLTLIASLCGTKWQLDTEGKILILEDLSESVYRIDRLLWQLKESGLLEKPSAVILGNWVDCDATSPYSLSLTQVFEHYFGNAPYPVIQGFPVGHDKYQTTLPLNRLAEIDTELKQVTILYSEGD